MKSENITSLHTGCKHWSEPGSYFLKLFNSMLDAIQDASPLALYVQLLLPSVGTEPRNSPALEYLPLCVTKILAIL